VTAGLRCRFGLDKLAPHEVAAQLTGGLLLAPAIPPVPGNTTAAAGSLVRSMLATTSSRTMKTILWATPFSRVQPSRMSSRVR